MPPAMTAIVPLSIAPSCAAAVDSPRQPGNDDHVFLPKIMRQPARKAARRRRRIARADDRHRRPVEQAEIALGDQQRRRIVQLGQQPRI